MQIQPSTQHSLAGTLPRQAAQQGEEEVGTIERAIFGTDGFTFGDILDIVNPLQHIPLVSTIYRSLTNDQIANGPRLLGDGLFGGLLSAAGGAVDVIMKESTGKDVGEHVLALVMDDEPQPSIESRPIEFPAYALMMDAFDAEFLVVDRARRAYRLSSDGTVPEQSASDSWSG